MTSFDPSGIDRWWEDRSKPERKVMKKNISV